MSHFYGTLQGTRGRATRCGTKNSGMTAQAAGWHGAIEVTTNYNAALDQDEFSVELIPWKSSVGKRCVLVYGTLDANAEKFTT